MFARIGIFFCWFIAAGLLTAFTPGPDYPTDNSSNPAPAGINYSVDSIVVHKGNHEMIVFSHNYPIKTYHIHLGISPVGAKQYMGDYKTPEGLYSITAKNPASGFHKSLGISYPSQNDVARALNSGKKPGGDIMIHGLPNGEEHVGPKHYQNDWTWGCIALNNAEIDELYQHVNSGVPILITP